MDSHILYASILEICEATTQAREVLNNLVLETSCGGYDLESHIARIHLERRNGLYTDCLTLLNDSIERFRSAGNIGMRERVLLVNTLECEKAEFICNHLPGNPKQALDYIFDVLRRDTQRHNLEEFLPLYKCAYSLSCKVEPSEERDKMVVNMCRVSIFLFYTPSLCFRSRSCCLQCC